MDNITFSVIMPVFLGEYENAATDRVNKFTRAVSSFLEQPYPYIELIVVCDGCDLAYKICQDKYTNNKKIKFCLIEKQPLFSGNVRQMGLELATGDYIVYLDGDDTFGTNHLKNLAQYIEGKKKRDWFYYNDYLSLGLASYPITKEVSLTAGSIGTSSICHKRSMKASWEGCDGYGHDWAFIQRLMAESSNCEKIKGVPKNAPQYFIHHVPKLLDK